MEVLYTVVVVAVLYVFNWLIKNYHRTDVQRQRRTVVITGGSQGIGFALASQFLEFGDSVVITSRAKENLEVALKKLQMKFPSGKVFGFVCDITNDLQLNELAKFAQEQMNRIDYWINNAGITQSVNAPLVQTEVDEIKKIIDTNVFGTLAATRVALTVMSNQPPITPKNKRGHVFLMDGAGSNGMSTPLFATYGMSKASYPQLLSSLLKETKNSDIGIHLLSPGMVITSLLVKKNPRPELLKLFNILCEKPETVAKWLVPRIRGVRSTGSYIKFLTFPGVLWRFATALLRRNRFFDPTNYVPLKFD